MNASKFWQRKIKLTFSVAIRSLTDYFLWVHLIWKLVLINWKVNAMSCWGGCRSIWHFSLNGPLPLFLLIYGTTMARQGILPWVFLLKNCTCLFSHPEKKQFISSVFAGQILEKRVFMSKKQNPEFADTENPNWTIQTFKKSRPAKEVLPKIFSDQISQELLKPRGRPRLETPKERINIRLSYEVIQHFKSSGVGWQTRIDAALREFIQSKPNSDLRRWVAIHRRSWWKNCLFWCF